MSTRYQVWSRHVPEEGEPFEFLEVSRTDFKVAQEDRAIFSDIFHRKAWVVDLQEKGNGQ
jgi:hypothetical protein